MIFNTKKRRNHVVNEMRALVHEARGLVSQAGYKGISAGNRLRSGASDAGDALERCFEDSLHAIRERPKTTIALALGVGLAIGAIIWNRRR